MDKLDLKFNAQNEEEIPKIYKETIDFLKGAGYLEKKTLHSKKI